MSKYTKEEILELVEQEDVEFIRLQFTDIFGCFKNVAITASQLERALENRYMFDGSAIEGFVRIEESDMYLYPDMDTFVVYPWRPQQGKVARLICDVYTADRVPFEGEPRYILKKVVQEARSMGYILDVGPECEFFLFNTDDYGNPTTITHEQASYFDMAPNDQAENVRRDIILSLEDMGYEIEASHHELAPGQHEIDFRYENALKAADDIMTFKMTVKTIAKRHGFHATFMPKPLADQVGSGMHVNLSLSDENGKNLFNDPTDPNGLSKLAYHFMAGVLKHIKGITAIANPLVNSYKRLVPGYEAPIHIAWSLKNRSPLIRIPSNRGYHTRIELRSPDPAANPYLILALCLAAGLDGIKNQLEAPEPVTRNLFTMTPEELAEAGIEELPETLGEALLELEKDEFLTGVLGRHLTRKYLEAKYKEWSAYCSQITEWEIDRYLRNF